MTSIKFKHIYIFNIYLNLVSCFTNSLCIARKLPAAVGSSKSYAKVQLKLNETKFDQA